MTGRRCSSPTRSRASACRSPGHKDNHSGLMTPAQMDGFAHAMNVRPGHEWDTFEGLTLPPAELERFLAAVPFNAGGTRRLRRRRAMPVPDTLPTPQQPQMSTQQGFGLILNEIAPLRRRRSPSASSPPRRT